jgi:hypothetical protein
MGNKKEKRKGFMNKKAQGLSTTTIILIVLGLIVLVILIFGFTMGWANVREWIAPSSNVDDVVQQCSIACNTDQKYAFCTEPRELKSRDDLFKDVTCYSLAEKKSVYGIEKCRLIDCNIFESEDLAKTNCFEVGQTVQYLDVLNVVPYSCEVGDIPTP